ncbi:MAG: hypothetical protein H6733_16380 [Alphaproteobacteria bacterium]|nr:hypothetical protein [Alphaproteobacteria bacterium]
MHLHARRLPFALIAAACCLSAAGCTAGIATSRLLSANRALHDIELRGAAELAPYEHAMAEQHLDKAIEESANSQYKTSVELSKASLAWSQQAISTMEGGGRDLEELTTSGEDLDDLDNIPEPKPADKPKPDDDFGDFRDEDDSE